MFDTFFKDEQKFQYQHSLKIENSLWFLLQFDCYSFMRDQLFSLQQLHFRVPENLNHTTRYPKWMFRVLPDPTCYPKKPETNYPNTRKFATRPCSNKEWIENQDFSQSKRQMIVS